MTPLHWYLASTGSWFASHGVQAVMFSWLVTIVLAQEPERVGVAQMALLLPATFLVLIGGGLADRFGGRRVAIAGQLLALLPPLLLIGVLLADALSFGLMLVYAVLMGTAQAFVTPARDGVLNQVASSAGVQRAVVLTNLTQFSLQVVGFGIAALADRVGAPVVIGIQVLALACGVFALAHLPAAAPRSGPAEALVPALARSIREGCVAVLRSPPMRAVALTNVAMAICFMSSFIVTLPLLLRDVYHGDAADLAGMNMANSIGLVAVILLLFRFGDVRRKGRALVLSHITGALALALAAAGVGYWALLAALFCWGASGGVAMSMSRTIMQEAAPDGLRGRIMAFFSFSFLGAGPVGALLAGYLVDRIGPAATLVVMSGAMFVVCLLLASLGGLWRAGVGHPPRAAGA